MYYIVTGCVRSGTSMMMLALDTGGIDAHFSEKQETTLRDQFPQESNPGGYWELDTNEKFNLEFPQCEGKVFKMLAPWDTMGNLATRSYRVIVMYRDVKDIEESVRKMNAAAGFKGQLSAADLELYEHYDKFMAKGLAILENRKDVQSIHRIQFKDVLHYPKRVFRRLQKLGWPIDVDKAAAVIQPRISRVG